MRYAGLRRLGTVVVAGLLVLGSVVPLSLALHPSQHRTQAILTNRGALYGRSFNAYGRRAPVYGYPAQLGGAGYYSPAPCGQPVVVPGGYLPRRQPAYNAPGYGRVPVYNAPGYGYYAPQGAIIRVPTPRGVQVNPPGPAFPTAVPSVRGQFRAVPQQIIIQTVPGY